MKTNLILLFSVAIILFTACEEETEIQPRDYPFILTQSPVVSSNGAEFKAEILDFGKVEILEYGFIWSYEENSLHYEFVKKLGTRPEEKEFMLNVTSGLEKDNVYNVRSYLKITNKTVFGSEVSFKSLGSLAPQIKSFSPEEGPIGTGIEIEGANFALSENENVVKIGKYRADVISFSEKRLVVKVPADVEKPEQVIITVETAGMKAESEEYFDLWFPWTLKSVSESNYCNTYFQIENKGYFLTDNSSEIRVFDLETGNWANNVFLPESSPKNGLKATVHQDKAYVFIGDEFWEYNPLENQWTRKADLPVLWRDYDQTNSCFYNYDNYICYISLNRDRKIWKYHIQNNEWTEDGIFPGNLNDNPWGNFSLKDANNGYIGLAKDFMNQFWKYEQDEKIWIDLGRIPINSYSFWGSAVLNNKIYLAFGQNDEWSDYCTNEVWEFDPTINKWTPFNRCPSKEIIFASFTYNNKAYFFAEKNIWEFDPSKN
jgi:hypothetical protein